MTREPEAAQSDGEEALRPVGQTVENAVDLGSHAWRSPISGGAKALFLNAVGNAVGPAIGISLAALALASVGALPLANGAREPSALFQHAEAGAAPAAESAGPADQVKALEDRLATLKGQIAEQEAALAGLQAETARTQKQLDELEFILARATRHAAVIGTSLSFCDRTVAQVYNTISRDQDQANPGGPRDSRGYTRFSMDVFLLGNGIARFDAYGGTNTMALDDRRSGAGTWKFIDDDVVISFGYAGRPFGTVVFPLDDLIALAGGSRRVIRAKSSSVGLVAARSSCG